MISLEKQTSGENQTATCKTCNRLLININLRHKHKRHFSSGLKGVYDKTFQYYAPD